MENKIKEFIDEFNNRFDTYLMEVKEYEDAPSEIYLYFRRRTCLLFISHEIQDVESQEETLRSFAMEVSKEYPYYYDMDIRACFEWICSRLGVVLHKKRDRNYEIGNNFNKLIYWAKDVVECNADVYCPNYDDLGSVTEWVVNSLKEATTIKEKIIIAAVFSCNNIKNHGLHDGYFYLPTNYEVISVLNIAEKNLKKGYVKVSCFDDDGQFSLRIDARYKYQEVYDSQKRIVFFTDNFGKEIHYRYDSEGNQYYSKNKFEWYDSSSRLVYNSSRGTKYVYSGNKCTAIHKDGTVHEYSRNTCNHRLNHKYMIKQNDEGKYICSLCGTTFTSVPLKQRG